MIPTGLWATIITFIPLFAGCVYGCYLAFRKHKSQANGLPYGYTLYTALLVLVLGLYGADIISGPFVRPSVIDPLSYSPMVRFFFDRGYEYGTVMSITALAWTIMDGLFCILLWKAFSPWLAFFGWVKTPFVPPSQGRKKTE